MLTGCHTGSLNQWFPVKQGSCQQRFQFPVSFLPFHVVQYLQCAHYADSLFSVEEENWSAKQPDPKTAHEKNQMPQTNMGYYSELLTTLQRNGISIENIVKTDSVVTIYNLVLNADFLTVIPCDMTTPFGSNQFITIPVQETLPVARYAAVWSKNYRIKKAASILVELAKEYSSYNCRRRRQLIEIN